MKENTNTKAPLIWAYLLHLGYNMWVDHDFPGAKHWVCYDPVLRCRKALWNELTKAMADAGLNMLVIDLGDGVQYESHPEIAVRGAWSVAGLRRELQRLRRLGLEPIPKLNFSTAHDAWLGPYSRCVSTDTYYSVCGDLIAEVIEIFGGPRFFHLGMDEETAEHQSQFEYALVRRHDLWWRDLYFLIDQVEQSDARPWVWSDYVWHHPELFYRKMPKSVLQSNWYYGQSFSLDRRRNERFARVRTYLDLDEAQYDQVPTGSNDFDRANFADTVRFCTGRLAPERLLGFLQTVWRPTLPEFQVRHLEAIDTFRQARLAAKF